MSKAIQAIWLLCCLCLLVFWLDVCLRTVPDAGLWVAVMIWFPTLLTAILVCFAYRRLRRPGT